MFTEYVLCPICLERKKIITKRHIENHGYSLDKFKEMYPNHELISDRYRENRNTSKNLDYSRVSESIKKQKREKRDKLEEEYNKNPNRCKYCGEPLPFGKRRTYCNGVCSNKDRKYSDEVNKKRSEAVLKYRSENPDKVIDNINNSLSSTKVRRKFSSEGERELLKILQDRFPDHGFTSGGCRRIAENTYKSFDIYSKKIKLIVEYDGAYHFKNIYGNLDEVKRKDVLTNEWCAKNGWKIIRINECTFYEEKEKAVGHIVSLIDKVKEIEIVTYLYWRAEIKDGWDYKGII